jgi:hypothetical protein
MQSGFSFLIGLGRARPAETDLERRLRALPPIYARPVPADVDVADVVGKARAVARSLDADADADADKHTFVADLLRRRS